MLKWFDGIAECDLRHRLDATQIPSPFLKYPGAQMHPGTHVDTQAGSLNVHVCWHLLLPHIEYTSFDPVHIVAGKLPNYNKNISEFFFLIKL